MRTIEKTIYSFSELSKEAQTKAIEKNRYINTQDNDWSYPVINDWITKLNEAGFPNAKIHADLYRGQGDGACFDADIDPTAFLTPIERKQLAYLDLSFEIDKHTTANYYSHERTRFVTLSVRGNYYLDNCELLNKITERIEKARYILSMNIYNDLREYYDALTSDEEVIASIEVNEYEFYEDGSMY